MKELKCDVQDCLKKRKKNSHYCSMHTARLVRTGRFDLKSIKERIQERSNVKPNGCIDYLRYKNKNGYGRLRFRGEKMLAHRIMWEQVVGKIPIGLMVLHKCDNPSCVNVEHLYLGTAKDNAQDMSRRGRQWMQRALEQGIMLDLYNEGFPSEYKRITQ